MCRSGKCESGLSAIAEPLFRGQFSARSQTGRKAGSREHTDHSLNVVVFGVPESRDLLGTEALVSRAFESVVERKDTDCRQIGRFSTKSVKSQLLLTVV